MGSKVSVIIPIYNVEPYLRQCLDSIVNQTYRNLEIILIDDGSPDHCGEICDEYAGKDDRIRAIHKQNEGLSVAWNDGLDMSTGDWIAFVDSDDWLDVDYFEKLLSTPQADSAEVIQSGGYYWEEKRGQFIRWAFLKPFAYRTKEEKDELKIQALIRSNDPKTKGTIGFTWGKLFRRRLLESADFRFDVAIRAGLMMDVLFNWDVFEKASIVLGVVYCGYHYRITQSSGTFKFDPNRAKAQEHVEEQFFCRVQAEETSFKLQKAVESRCLRDIVHNLQRCYFHPDNPSAQQEITEGIRRMKQMPYYKAAIVSKKNPYNNAKLKAFQFALKLPWIWPLRVMVAVWSKMDKRETKVM